MRNLSFLRVWFNFVLRIRLPLIPNIPDEYREMTKGIAIQTDNILLDHFENANFHKETRSNVVNIVADIDLVTSFHIGGQFLLQFPTFSVLNCGFIVIPVMGGQTFCTISRFSVFSLPFSNKSTNL
jgi:hypothetical protein